VTLGRSIRSAHSAQPVRGGRIRVMLVDDSFHYRMFLRELIEAQADMEVVGESGDGMSAAQRIGEVAPDVVLMDVTMPGMDGIEATRRITASGVDTKVIVVSAFSDPGAMKVPFFHNNDDYEEVIFYHAGDFFSRDNIHPGMLTFHPSGFTHGPHPKALSRMLVQAKPATDEYAVMVDTRDALEIGEAARRVEWAGYVDSWKGPGAK